MLIWCTMLFGVGIIIFLDTFFNFGMTLRITSSVIIIFLSAVLLVRTIVFKKLKKVEKLIEQNAKLEKKLEEINSHHTQKSEKQEKLV